MDEFIITNNLNLVKKLKRRTDNIDVLASVVSVEPFKVNKIKYLKMVYLISDCSQNVFLFKEVILQHQKTFELFGLSADKNIYNDNPRRIIGLSFNATLTPEIINGNLRYTIKNRTPVFLE